MIWDGSSGKFMSSDEMRIVQTQKFGYNNQMARRLAVGW